MNTEVGWHNTLVEEGKTYRVEMKDCCIGNVEFESKLETIVDDGIQIDLFFENGVSIQGPQGETIEEVG